MPNGDSSKKIFTHKMWESYGWLPVPTYDVRFNNRPFISNKKSVSFNADEIAETFMKNMENVVASYRSTKHVFQ